MSVAEDRANEAWDQRYKHVKAASAWQAAACGRPESREVSEILAKWMSAYSDADAAAERAFRELASREARERLYPVGSDSGG